MNTAQKLYAEWVGLDLDWYGAETIKTAVEQTRELVSYQKAPHAARGTPQRKPRRLSSVLMPRLFKGHRP